MEITEINSSNVTELNVKKGEKKVINLKFNNSYKAWFFIGVFFLICAILISVTTYQGEKDVDYINATITDIDYAVNDEDENDVYVSYHINGVEYEDVYLSGFFQFFYKIGDEVEIRYNITDPSIISYVRFVRVLSGLLYYYGIVSIAVGICLYFKKKKDFEWC